MTRWSRALLAALLVFVAGRCLVPMDETDVFFNLRLGELILRTHAVPRTNVLSFTFPDARDINLAWLFQIVLALAHRAGGIPGSVVLKTAFVVATFAVLWRVALRRGAHPAAAAVALALAAWAAEPRFVERPHLVTFLGLALTLLAVERAEADQPRSLWALVPAGLVWANANSCFFLAPSVLALYALGARLDRRPTDARRGPSGTSGPTPHPATPAASGGALAALVALALAPLILATPSGVHALEYIANHFRMPSLRPLQEYRPATWPLDGPFFFLAALLLLGGMSRSRQWRHLLPAVALGLLGARRIRFVAEFALVAGPIAAVALTRALDRVSVRARAAASAGALALLATVTLAPRLAAARRGERVVDLGVEADLVPTAAIRFATDMGFRARMYNDLEVGSYLTWEGWPRFQVFQDPRINGYPEAFHAILCRADLPHAEWQALLDRFGVTSALITYPSLNPRATLFDPERWALVYRDREALLFARRSPDWARVVDAYELPITFARDADGAVAPRPLGARPGASTVADCVWDWRLADVLVELGNDESAHPLYAKVFAERGPGCAGPEQRRLIGIALGDLDLRRNDPAGAVEAYAEVHDEAVRVRRGFALLALARPAEALADFAEARDKRWSEPDLDLGTGLALAALGHRAEASAALETFLRRAPTHAGAPRARAALAKLR